MILSWFRRDPAILIVDDTEDILALFKHVLEKSGYRVRVARNGEEAVRYTTKEPIRLIILDLMLPVTDGFTLLGHWKKDPKTKDIPVIMLTGRQQGKDIETAFRAGAVGYLIKPCPPERLLAKVREVLAPAGGGAARP